MIGLLKAVFVIGLLLIGSLFLVVPLYFGGYISREMITVTSPDGSRQAVCRGWYPHGMDYEMWLRRRGEWFGQRIGKVGGESMGRCAAVAWSADGTSIAASSTSGHITMFDAERAGVVGGQHLDELVYPGWPDRPYTTPRMVTALSFASDGVLRVETCGRLSHTTRHTDDAFRCAGGRTADLVPVRLEQPRGMQLRWAVASRDR